MANYKSDSDRSDRPNHVNALEAGKGKYAVYVFFTKEELERIQAHCNGMRINMSKWISGMVKDELMLSDLMDKSKDI
jgi:hypothetical protein